MGIVIRQSIITSVISYIGILIGYLNVVYLYPTFLSLEQIGLMRTVIDCAMLIVPFAQFGLAQSLIRFFPVYAADKKEGAFVSFLFFLSIVGFGIFLFFFLLFEKQILAYFEKADDVTSYIELILTFAFVLQVLGLLEQYSRSLLRIAFPNLLREVVARLLQSVLVFLYFSGVISFHLLMVLTVGIFLVCAIALFLYILKVNPTSYSLRLKIFTAEKTREIILFSSTSFVGVSAMIIVAKTDSVMVAAMLGLSANAIYTQAFYIATVIEIPKRAITQTASTLIARAFAANKPEEVQRIYQKTAINQLIVGGLLLIGLFINTENIFLLMPKGEIFSAGASVMIVIGAGKLIDMFFGPSSEIIGLSKYYWFNLVVISLLAVIVIVCNQVFIPRYGLTGAALGTFIALFFYNFLKFIFIYAKLNMQPFNLATVKVLLIAASCLLLNYLLPRHSNVLVDIFYRSGIITLWYGGWVLGTKCSAEINSILIKIIQLGRRYLKRLTRN